MRGFAPLPDIRAGVKIRPLSKCIRPIMICAALFLARHRIKSDWGTCGTGGCGSLLDLSHRPKSDTQRPYVCRSDDRHSYRGSNPMTG